MKQVTFRFDEKACKGRYAPFRRLLFFGDSNVTLDSEDGLVKYNFGFLRKTR